MTDTSTASVPPPPFQHPAAPPLASPGSQIAAPASGLAVAALIVGGIAFVIGWVPVVGLLVGGTAVALGVIALVKRQKRLLAGIGLALGAVAAITSISFLAVAIASSGADRSTTTAVVAPAAETATVPVPDLVGLAPDSAQAAAEALGFIVEFDGDVVDAVVISSDPVAGTDAEKGSVLTLRTETPVEEPVAAPAPAPALVDVASFRAEAGGHIDDINKDLDDMVITLAENGFWRLLSNTGEVAFNLGQLEALDVPASISAQWAVGLTGLDTSLTSMSDSIATSDPAAIKVQIDATRAAAENLRAIAATAV